MNRVVVLAALGATLVTGAVLLRARPGPNAPRKAAFPVVPLGEQARSRQSKILASASAATREKYQAGLAALSRGELQAAIRDFNLAAAKSPNAALIHLSLGEAYNAAVMPEDALQALTAAIELEPDLTEAWVLLAALRAKSKDWKRAETYLTKALSLEPTHEEARLVLSHVLLQKGDRAGAEQVARLAATTQPRSAPALMALANALDQKAEPAGWEEAMTLYQRAAEASKAATVAHALALRRAGEVANRLGRPLVAREVLQQAVRSDPNDYTAWHQLSRSLREIGDGAGAAKAALQSKRVEQRSRQITTLRERLYATPKPELFFQLGALEEESGRVAAAATAYRAGLARKPDDLAAMRALKRLTMRLEQ